MEQAPHRWLCLWLSGIEARPRSAFQGARARKTVRRRSAAELLRPFQSPASITIACQRGCRFAAELASVVGRDLLAQDSVREGTQVLPRDERLSAPKSDWGDVRQVNRDRRSIGRRFWLVSEAP